jgi:hypothetical protein
MKTDILTEAYLQGLIHEFINTSMPFNEVEEDKLDEKLSLPNKTTC